MHWARDNSSQIAGCPNAGFVPDPILHANSIEQLLLCSRRAWVNQRQR